MRRVTPLLLAVALLATLLPAQLAAASDDIRPRAVQLDVEDVRDVAFDDRNRQLYVTADDELLVFAPDGTLRRRVSGLPGAAEMDLSDDGRRLWVATPRSKEVVAIDTSGLAVAQRIPLGPDACAWSVVALDGKLLLGSSCSGNRGYSTVSTSPPHTVVRADGPGPAAEPTFAHTAAMGDVVVGGGLGISPVTLHTIDTSTTPARVAEPRRGDGGNLNDLAARPDGAEVVQASGSPYDHHAYRPGDLARVHTYPTSAYPRAAAWSADGTTLAAGTSSNTGEHVRVFRAGASTPSWTHGLRHGDLIERGVALDGDGTWLYAVSEDFGEPDGEEFTLEIAEVGATPGTVRGTIRGTSPGGRVDEVRFGLVQLIDVELDEVVRTGETFQGEYELRDVPPGRYQLTFANVDRGDVIDFFPELYRRQPVFQFHLGTVVTVGEGATVTVDGNLDPLFTDMFDTVFTDDIFFLRNIGVTRGCNPTRNNTRFCPDDVVTRGQMAAFLTRFLLLSDIDRGVDFRDIDRSVFHDDIRRLATAEITRGCNPSQGNTRFCPDDPVTRGQMAAFLVRAFGMRSISADFDDIDGSVFHDDIRRLATAGITKGCNPSQGNTRFCPDDPVTRGQMAAFLRRTADWLVSGSSSMEVAGSAAHRDRSALRVRP